jgi:hydroxylamine dehydrogenase
MAFRSVFIAVVIATGLLVAALIVNRFRPVVEGQQPSAPLARAVGKCAECHRQETSAVVHQFELSQHAAKGITCLDCHHPVNGQPGMDHRGFVISKHLTAANCAECHKTQYDQYLRSRHAAPAWAAVSGPSDFSPEQIAAAEKFHPGAVKRAANALAQHEGPAAITKGCVKCHEVGRPNPDGSIGSCTSCHARHSSSVELARTPETCGQCHMGPDHSQVEIYHESKHGVLFNAQHSHFNLGADPKKLTTADMPVPTCSTCHMSGLEGMNITHDTTERLSMYLFADITDKRPNYAQGQVNMKEICLKCHTQPAIETFYHEAEHVVDSTNAIITEAGTIMKSLQADGLLTPKPFDEPIEYEYFDMWHYYGRTAKHGAFMGGADFVQWHGFYELVHKLSSIKHHAEDLRAAAAQKSAKSAPAAK